jgi:hypothetical protein
MPQVFAEAFLGTAVGASTRLTVRQSGEKPISVSAEYSTRPFEGSPYYAWRVGFWRGSTGWAVGLVHHKLYLENAPPGIDRFEISHGFNLIALTHGWRWNATWVRAGGGPVLAHAETTIRGRSKDADGLFGRGYYLTGPSAQAALGRYVHLRSGVALALEAMVSGSRARVPVADGQATVPNFALHLHVGLSLGAVTTPDRSRTRL